MKEFDDLTNYSDIEFDSLVDLITTKVERLRKKYPNMPEDVDGLKMLVVNMLGLIAAFTELSRRQQEGIDEAIAALSETRSLLAKKFPDEVHLDA